MIFETREGFRSRLENIVRGQVSNQSDNSANRNISDSRTTQSQSSTSPEVPNENHEEPLPRNQEIDTHPMLEHTGESGNNTPIEDVIWQESASQGGTWQAEITEDGRRDWEQSEGEFNEWQEATTEEMDGNWQENTDRSWPAEIPEHEDDEDNHLQDVHEEWNENGSQEVVDDWQDGPSDPSRMLRAIPIRHMNRFHPPDDDNVYSMELRELLSRYLVVLFFTIWVYML